jgi:hypothetical protein
LDAKLDAEFSAITGFRELADGRVLVADLTENRLLVADFRSGKVVAVGRSGDGPGEFRRVAPLFGIGHDSTMMPDGGNPGRWLLLAGAKIVATLSAEVTPLGSRYASIKGVDGSGRVLAAILPRHKTAEPRGVDSLLLVAVGRTSRKVDTITRLRAPFPRGAMAFGEMVAWRPGPDAMTARLHRDEAVLLDDGWIAIVRRGGDRVEWRTPAGASVIAPKRLAAKPCLDPGDGSSAARRRGDGPRPDALLPSLLPAPGGRVLVQCLASDGSPATRYEIIGNKGGAVGVLSLADNERVIGFGAKAIYVVVTDDVGIQRLQRHPWP